MNEEERSRFVADSPDCFRFDEENKPDEKSPSPGPVNPNIKALPAKPDSATVAKLRAAFDKARSTAAMPQQEVEAVLADLSRLSADAVQAAVAEADPSLGRVRGSKTAILQKVRRLLEAGRRATEQTAH